MQGYIINKIDDLKNSKSNILKDNKSTIEKNESDLNILVFTNIDKDAKESVEMINELFDLVECKEECDGHEGHQVD